MRALTKKGSRYALVRLGRKRNILYSEYLRAKNNGQKKEEMIETISQELEKYKEKSNKFKANRIMIALLKIGVEEGEGEDNA